MYLLVIVLNKTEYLNKVMEVFLKTGIKGATILDSKGMGGTIMDCDDIPVVGGIRKLFYTQCRPNNNTIFSIVESKEKANQCVEKIEEIIGSLDEPGVGVSFVLSLESAKGIS